MRWQNLVFTLTKRNKEKLILGTDGLISKYVIKKSNELFDNLLTFDEELNERELNIEVYFENIADITTFQSFFELSKKGQSYKYDLQIKANNRI